MTREEIIKALEEGITSWGMYNVNWDAMDAIEADAEPFGYVKPILEIIAAHPDIDFGTPVGCDRWHEINWCYKICRKFPKGD